MKRSTLSGDIGDDSVAPQSEASGTRVEADWSVAETNSAEPQPSPSDAHTGEGSVGYRVAALIGMLILAITALGVWLYFRK